MRLETVPSVFNPAVAWRGVCNPYLSEQMLGLRTITPSVIAPRWDKPHVQERRTKPIHTKKVKGKAEFILKI